MSGPDFRLVKDATFSSYSEWYESIEGYQKKQNVTMSRSSSRLINRAEVNKELIYVELSYKCSKAGVYKPKGKGVRNVNSNKTNCPAFIEVRVPKNKQVLKITNICLTHNHDSHLLNSTQDKLKTEEPTESTDGPIPDTSGNKTPGHASSSNEIATIDTSMPYDVTDLLEITYASEALECISNPDTCNKEKEALSDSIKSLSLNENIWNGEKDSEPPATTTLKESNNKNTIVIPTTSVEPSKSEEAQPKCNVYDTSSAMAVRVTELDKIVMTDMNSKGRPRGRALMAIGLPIKKRPIRFLEQEPEVQARTILHWFISDNEQCQIENALTGEYMIRDIDIPSEYRDLPDSVMADEVDLSVLKQYMENAAYEKIVKLIQKKKDLGIWTCKICKKDLSDRSVLCESCLAWHDYKCVNLRRAPKSEEWYCRSCKL